VTTNDTPNPHPNGRPHNNNTGRFEPSQHAAEKAARAARLKADNPQMTYQQIADAVGYNNKSDAWRAIQRCREAVIREAGAELIASEAQQLDDLFVAAMEVLERDHVVVSHGRIVKGDDGNPILDDGPKLAALREMRQIRESYRRLFGVDSETKVNVSGAVRYEVVGVDADALK